MVLNQPLSKRTQNVSTPKKQYFNYYALDNEARIVVEERTREIKSLMRRTSQEIIEIGQKLIEVKQQLGHGNFRNWLKAEFEWGIWMATKFIQVAEKFESVKFTHLDFSASALYLLASPSTSDCAREEAIELATQGETISYTKAKSIINHHKEGSKLKANAPINVSSDTEIATEVENSSTPAHLDPASEKAEAQNPAVVKRVENKLHEQAMEASVDFQVSQYGDGMATRSDSSDYLLKNQIEKDGQAPFWVGYCIYLTSSDQEESKLLGQVIEVKEVNATDVVIRVSFHP